MTFDPQQFLKHLSNQAGVYQMLGAAGEVLYVGKARNLKKRVSSYFRDQSSIKVSSLVKQIKNIEVIVTRSDTEALLLENNLIKKYKPRYNILLRDDKSYPYIVLTDHKEFPRLDFYRGKKREKGKYFGPFPSAGAVRDTLNFLQKVFQLRSCQDDFFKNRTRPCLQYQIKRCTAPCVGYITPEDYQQDVNRALMFLEGKNQELVAELAHKMENAAENLDFELAAHYRDQITKLRQIQQPSIMANNDNDVDVFAVQVQNGSACVEVLTIRMGRVLGGKAFFPKIPEQNSAEEILAAFIPQYYLTNPGVHEIPQQIVLSHKIEDAAWIAEALSESAERKIIITTQPRGERARWLEIASRTAHQSLTTHLADRFSVEQRLQALQELLGLENMPQRIECFDISHSQGEATVASCVVYDEQGIKKSDYRRFNIEGVTPGDDYGAMYQALTRRYLHVKTSEGRLPDVLLIDGGKGQLSQAEKVLEELQISEICVVAIAKGPLRKAGFEKLFRSGNHEIIPVHSDSLALHLLQQIRDEAHRFAITGHRGQRAKARKVSSLEAIPGIGAKRRRELLRLFGGLQELKRATVEEIAKVPGISKELAQRIYEALQDL